MRYRLSPIDGRAFALQALRETTRKRMAVPLRFVRNPFAALFTRSKREDHLVRYVIRECSRGRSLNDVLDDAYVRNRASEQERARLLDRPEVIAAVGTYTIEELRPGRTALDWPSRTGDPRSVLKVRRDRGESRTE